LTPFGGLLFLLNVEDLLRIPERVIASSEVASRSFAWFQHRLALTLLPLQPDDPAVLAFCGLGPDAEDPTREEPSPAPGEQEAVDRFSNEIRNALAEALPEQEREPGRVLEFVCRRQARIVADPGWIEARFNLKDVATEIRRAGLDLDPNYLPWLGVVVRFVYE
jgi:hypothetical protein